MFLLQETWFDQNILDSEITKNTNFSIHRQDRQDTSHPKKNGGGVATIIRNEIVTKRHFVTTIKILQYICLEIHITSLKKFLINIYFPFEYSNESSRELGTLLRHISTLDNTIIMGDFNMPSISWSPDLNLPGVYLPTGTQTDEFFINLFFANDLKQIREPIANKNHLDLAFTDDENMAHCVQPTIEECLDRTSLHHAPFVMNVQIPSVIEEKITYLNYGRTNLKKD